MLFSSITFLYYFLPITLLLYFCMPMGHGIHKLQGKNSLLLLASFLFYAMGEPKLLLLMVVSVMVGYLGGRILTHYPRKWILIGCVGLQLSLLGIFKYTDFFLEIWNQVTGMQVGLLRLALPIGISFYSFQIISYVVDVYRQDMEGEKNFINFAAYITMFPQLIAGPIVRYDVVKEQMHERKITLANVSDGGTRFLIGLGKKVLLADNIGELLLRMEQLEQKSMWTYWVVALMYVLQIYHDFSGYSDMAIGLGKMLGFYFPENFHYPLMARSITEFWRRWHISLGTFLKDYIYVPLKGSHCSTKRWIWNVMVVWFLSGLWHGASWNFVLWGMYFGVFLILEKLGTRHISGTLGGCFISGESGTGVTSGTVQEDVEAGNPGVILRKWISTYGVRHFMHGIQHGYTWMVITISFVLFRFTNLQVVIAYLREMFRMGNGRISWLEWYEYGNSAVLIGLCMIGATPFAKNVVQYLRGQAEPMISGLEVIFQIGMLLIVTAFLIQSSVHPFLYFRF